MTKNRQKWPKNGILGLLVVEWCRMKVLITISPFFIWGKYGSQVMGLI